MGIDLMPGADEMAGWFDRLGRGVMGKSQKKSTKVGWGWESCCCVFHPLLCSVWVRLGLGEVLLLLPVLVRPGGFGSPTSLERQDAEEELRGALSHPVHLIGAGQAAGKDVPEHHGAVHAQPGDAREWQLLKRPSRSHVDFGSLLVQLFEGMGLMGRCTVPMLCKGAPLCPLQTWFTAGAISVENAWRLNQHAPTNFLPAGWCILKEICCQWQKVKLETASWSHPSSAGQGLAQDAGG